MYKKKLKILYLTNIPSPYRVDFFNELGKKSDLTVLFEQSSHEERESIWHNYNFEEFKAIFLKKYKIKEDKVINFEVIRYLKKNEFDHIIIGGHSTLTGMFAVNYLKIKRIPFILNVDGGFIPAHENKLKYQIKKYFISNANYWLSTGKKSNEYLKYYGAKEGNTFIYPFTTTYHSDILTCPLNADEKKNYKEKLNIPENKILLTVGQFIHRKGFDVLIEATRKLPKDYGVYFIGGEATNEYLSLKEKYNLKNIHFVGFKSKEELNEYYKASDLFVLPTREDIWGLVINEAISFGLPVITTDNCVAGLELVTNDYNGFIVPVEDSKELSIKINQIISDDKLTLKMGKNSLKTAEKYTIEAMAEKHLKILNRLMKNKYL